MYNVEGCHGGLGQTDLNGDEGKGRNRPHLVREGKVVGSKS
jgi:hypothetical protein